MLSHLNRNRNGKRHNPLFAAPLGSDMARILPEMPPDSAPRQAAHAAHVPYRSRKAGRASFWGAVVGMVSLLAWLVLINVGLVVDSKVYRTNVAQMYRHSLGYQAENLGMMFISYTWSNVALLCCLAAVLGAVGHRAMIGGRSDKLIATMSSDCWNQYIAAVLRGFFIYLLLLTGGLLFGSIELSKTSADAYAHLAGAASLFSFLIGRDPDLFAKLVLRVKELNGDKGDDADEPGTPGRLHMDAEKVTAKVTTERAHMDIPVDPALLGQAVAAANERK